MHITMQANFASFLVRRLGPFQVAVFAVLAFSATSVPSAHAQFTFASDNATNYGGTWNNGSDQGSGFGA